MKAYRLYIQSFMHSNENISYVRIMAQEIKLLKSARFYCMWMLTLADAEYIPHPLGIWEPRESTPKQATSVPVLDGQTNSNNIHYL